VGGTVENRAGGYVNGVDAVGGSYHLPSVEETRVSTCDSIDACAGEVSPRHAG
jgi:hypothetical protein